MDEDDKWLLRGNHQAEEIILIDINGYKSKPYFDIRVDSKKITLESNEHTLHFLD